MKGSKYSSLLPDTELQTLVSTLFQLPNLSQPVQQILKTWLGIRGYVKNQGGRKTFSSFTTISKQDFANLTHLADKFDRDNNSIPIFKQSSLPQSIRGDRYDREFFHSIRLYGASGGHSFLFPWNLFIEVRHNDDLPFLKKILMQLIRNPEFRNLPQFVDLFTETRAKYSVARTNLSVKYLQALARAIKTNSSNQLPSQRELVEHLQCSERAIERIENVYWYLGVVSPRYLTNLGKLGFQAIRVNHSVPLPPELEPFTLRTIHTRHPRYISILYIPIESNVFDFIPEDYFEINQYHISRNLDQLTTKTSTSWKEPVRILNNPDLEIIDLPSSGFFHDITPKENQGNFSQNDFWLIDQVNLVAGGYYSDIAKALGISVRSLRRKFQKLLQEKIFAPFVVISRIGLETWLMLSYEGTTEEVKYISNTLQALPYAEMFIGDTCGTAVVKLPGTWVGSFLEDIKRLERKGWNIWAEINSPIIARWGIPLTKIAEQRDFFGLQWRE